MPSIRAEQTPGPAPASASKRSKPRVTIYRNEDGSYDTSSLSDEDKDRLFGSKSGPAPAPGPAPASAPPIDPIDPAVIGLALNLLTSIESAIVGQKLGIPQDRVFQTLQLKPPFEEMVTGAAAKVANKYGANLGPYADEIALVALLATWQIGAFAELRAIVAEMDAKKPAPAPPNADHGKHQSPKEKPVTPAATPAPAPSANVPPIDMLLGAHSNVSGHGV